MDIKSNKLQIGGMIPHLSFDRIFHAILYHAAVALKLAFFLLTIYGQCLLDNKCVSGTCLFASTHLVSVCPHPSRERTFVRWTWT